MNSSRRKFRARSIRARPIYRSRLLWSIYFVLVSVLVVSALTMFVLFAISYTENQIKPTSIATLQTLAVASGGGIGVALALGYVLTQKVRQHLDEIILVARAMTQGDFEARVANPRKDEFGVLGRALNLLGEELSNRMMLLSQERAQLQAILSGLNEGIVAIDNNDRVLYVNQAAQTLLGIELKSLDGPKLSAVHGLNVLLPTVLKARSVPDLVENEIFVSRNQREHEIEVRGKNFRGEDEDGVVIVLNEVTQLRRLEKIRRDFVANVSHELKTPLTSIKGYVETLQMGAKDDPKLVDRFLTKIEQNVLRLVDLVQDILSLAKIEAEQGIVGLKEKVLLDDVLNDVWTLYEDRFEEKKLTLERKVVGRPFAVGEREAMFQILDNLLSNAIKHTEEQGKISVRIWNEGSTAQLEVEDSGIGIAQEHLPRIFERFYRVDKARGRGDGGTGLGLSIVKHLAASMNGSVAVESQLGKGTTFKVRLNTNATNTFP